MSRAVGFVAWSDYLCPWCWNAARRLERLRADFGGRVQIRWQSYLLRPVARGERDPIRFRRYTESWTRPAAEPDAGEFNPWASNDPPPSHSVPAHCVAKAARLVSEAGFARIHLRLMSAYFSESRDISSFEVLREIWLECDLPLADFERARDPVLADEARREHAEARRLGASGVPAIRRIDNEAIVIGAQPESVYRRWIERSLERDEGLIDVSRDDP